MQNAKAKITNVKSSGVIFAIANVNIRGTRCEREGSGRRHGHNNYGELVSRATPRD